MPTITFDKISKSYGPTEVIHEFSAEIPDKEFMVLLGPSGCGKSTMLRMIAGLVDITSGDLRFDGRSVERLDPRARGVAFVFQSYALYPHMTVRQNIAFPLLMNEFKWWHHIPGINAVQRRRVLHRPEVVERIERIATTLQLHEYLDRKPRALSGGQRQRVAVARALVREPSIYLLDEPLSNLDARLRTQMRAEIINLFNTVQRTFVYVTHDQVEAMTMGTRIVVMDKGRIQQIGTPEEIYEQPVNTFVAQFIGSPPMNLMGVSLDRGVARFGDGSAIALPADRFPSDRAGPATFGVRAEKVRLVAEGTPTSVRARVVTVERLGAETVVGFSLFEGDSWAPLTAPSTLYFARVAGNPAITRDSQCFAALDLDGAALFDADTGERVPAAGGPQDPVLAATEEHSTGTTG